LKDIRILLTVRKSYQDKETKKLEIKLSPEDYIIEGNKIKKNINDSDSLNMFNQECQPAFMPIDVPAPRGPIFVFGEYFLRKFYTVFDRDEKVLGIAPANHTNDQSGLINTPYDKVDTSLEAAADAILDILKKEGIDDINLINP
jgi:hypothetical protein